MRQWWIAAGCVLLISYIGYSVRGDIPGNFPAVSKPYTPDQAAANGDVVLAWKYNMDKWDRFLQQVKDGKKDQVRITGYTTEGDPTFYELKFDGKRLHYTYDNSRDAFGGSDKGRQSTVCAGIENATDKNRGSYYVLTGCESESVGRTFFWY